MILGYSYKPELGDCRETPVRPLIQNLLESGIEVYLFDPNISESDVPEGVVWVENPLNLENDLVVIATAHRQIIELDWSTMLEECTTKTIYDGRRSFSRPVMENEGWKYRGIGVPK